MAEQAIDNGEETESAASLLPGTPHALEHNPGRPVSWVGTSVVIIGFIVGGIAFFPSPHWVLFWVGVGIAIIGCLVLAFSKAMNTDWY